MIEDKVRTTFSRHRLRDVSDYFLRVNLGLSCAFHTAFHAIYVY